MRPMRAPMPTLLPLVARYVSGRRDRGEIRPATARALARTLRTFAVHYGARPVSQLSRTHVEAWVGSMPNLAPNTRRAYLAAVRSFCRWLVETGAVRRDPTVGVRPPRAPRSVPRALSPDDFAALWRVLPDARARLMVGLMHDLGLRIGEVTRLQVSDLDDSSAIVTVMGKGGHVRTVPLTRRVSSLVGAYLAAEPMRGRTGPLIRSHNGRRSALTPAAASELVSAWFTAAGIRQRPWDGRSAHALRHTAASEIADVEPDLRVVQALLGHANLSSTQVYLRRVDLCRMRVAMDRRSAA